MTTIMTVTLNPALDLATSAEAVRPGPKLRCGEPRADPGGGGINVARVIRRLGGRVQAFVALGGATGQRLAALVAKEKMTCQQTEHGVVELTLQRILHNAARYA